jgi:hypothetical protein
LGAEKLEKLAISPPPAVSGTLPGIGRIPGQPPSLTQAVQTGARMTGQEILAGGTGEGQMLEKPPELGEVGAGEEQPQIYSGQGQPNVGDISKDEMWSWNGAGWVHTPMQLQLMAVKDFESTGGKNLARIANFSKALNQGVGDDLSENQKNTMYKLNTAENLISTYSNYLIDEGLSTTPATGLPAESRIKGYGLKLQSALGLEPSGAVKAFGNAREGTMSLLAKSLGEVGTMTDQDIARARRLVPDVTMSPQEIAKNMELLMGIIQQAKQQLQATGGGMGELPELTELGQGATATGVQAGVQ